MEKGYAVYVLIEDFEIVYIGISSNFHDRKKQHKAIGKIKFDCAQVLIHGLDKETAEIIESTIIYFSVLNLGLNLKNKNHNPMFNVWNSRKISLNREVENV